MAKVSISEAARLAGKSRTTLHRLIKTGELSVSTGERNSRMIDISELARVFPDLKFSTAEQPIEQVHEQRVTGDVTDHVHENDRLKQEIEHLKTLVSSQQSHIDSLKQAMLLIEHKQQSEIPHQETTAATKLRSRWAFWRK
ncbi:helix-turn-helix domain-containing protein [Rosenbergiella nectarea]|uniref:helix-turn-helix domain-containing protein n=1 Tax=Rosenbergiella nectarea TaxID=988801 RepID=UPI001BDAFD88|nr:helix-turn-helix domain-containing protein [Rosenbergiella nectarea]MBT0731672.1 helix-turn-helix domain-containing protein [Rosenbergiella nectarea subsp. apis]